MEKIIRAITLRRPWGAAILHYGKDIENRGWKCSLPIGSILAIHSGKGWDETAIDFIKYQVKPKNFEDYISTLDPVNNYYESQIIAVATFAGNCSSHSSPWFVGEYGWKLENIVPIATPITCKGQQKLWTIPEHISEQLTAFQV